MGVIKLAVGCKITVIVSIMEAGLVREYTLNGSGNNFTSWYEWGPGSETSQCYPNSLLLEYIYTSYFGAFLDLVNLTSKKTSSKRFYFHFNTLRFYNEKSKTGMPHFNLKISFA